MSKAPTWNDLHNGKPDELKRVYKMNQAQLEMAHRKHLDGASTPEMRKEYEQLWRKQRSDA